MQLHWRVVQCTGHAELAERMLSLSSPPSRAIMKKKVRKKLNPPPYPLVLTSPPLRVMTSHFSGVVTII